MPVTYFERGCAAAGLAGVLTAAAMLAYPGGTPANPGSPGYDFYQNFLSDLGMTASYAGQRNYLGAALFVASVAILLIGIGSVIAGALRHYASYPAARPIVRAASGLGLLIVLLSIGVAVTPENLVMDLHVLFTRLAWRAAPVFTLLMAVATFRIGPSARNSWRGWTATTVVLVGYVITMELAPIGTAAGFTVQVVAQKVATLAAVVAALYQAWQLDRQLGRQIVPTSF